MEVIRLFKPGFDSSLHRVEEVLKSGWTAPGQMTQLFEAEWSKYSGHSHCLFTSSCSAGLLTALSVLKKKWGWGPEDKVLTSSLTFVATNGAIVQSGLLPQFCDVDNTLCLSPDSLRTRRSDRVVAVLYTLLGGREGDLKAVEEICAENGWRLILDAAHCLPITTKADFVVYSFQSVKPLSCGDGGMVCTEEQELKEEAKVFAWHGISQGTAERNGPQGYSWEYEVSSVGWKCLGNSISAAIGLSQLEEVGVRAFTRRENRASLRPHFKNSRVLGFSRSCHLLQVETDNRDSVILELRKLGIEAGVHYKPNHFYPPYRKFMGGPLPRTEEAGRRLLTLPCHEHLTEEEVGRITWAIEHLGL